MTAIIAPADGQLGLFVDTSLGDTDGVWLTLAEQSPDLPNGFHRGTSVPLTDDQRKQLIYALGGNPAGQLQEKLERWQRNLQANLDHAEQQGYNAEYRERIKGQISVVEATLTELREGR